MERKTGSVAVAVTSEEVRAAFRKVQALTSEEEKALRMRHGVSAPDLTTPLPRAAGANVELEDELLVIEMQLMRAWRRRLDEEKAQGVKPAPTASRTKDKIVRALRKKR
jgi:ribosomal protein L10